MLAIMKLVALVWEASAEERKDDQRENATKTAQIINRYEGTGKSCSATCSCADVIER